MKFNTLILETVIIMAGLIIAGCIAAVVFRPESSTPIIVLVSTLAGVGVSTILQLRGVKVNAAKIDAVQATAEQTAKQTNGINSVLLANLQTLVKHVTAQAPLNTGEIEAIRDNVVNAQAEIDRTKGIR